PGDPHQQRAGGGNAVQPGADPGRKDRMVMNKTYRKNIVRTLASSRGRFLAIFSIVALGVGFLAGLVSTTPDMRQSVETYLDGAGLYDIRIIGTLGLTQDDVQALQAVEGVRAVQPAYSADLLVDIPAADSAVARVHSLPAGE